MHPAGCCWWLMRGARCHDLQHQRQRLWPQGRPPPWPGTAGRPSRVTRRQSFAGNLIFLLLPLYHLEWTERKWVCIFVRHWQSFVPTPPRLLLIIIAPQITVGIPCVLTSKFILLKHYTYTDLLVSPRIDWLLLDRHVANWTRSSQSKDKS
jgi:hypothetical protein